MKRFGAVVLAILVITALWVQLRSRTVPSTGPAAAVPQRDPAAGTAVPTSTREIATAMAAVQPTRYAAPNFSTPVPPAPPSGENLLAMEAGSLLDSVAAGRRLTAAQKQKFTELYQSFQNARGTFEAENAKSREDAGRLIIEIEPYPDAGLRLRELYYSALTSALGREDFERLDQELGTRLDQKFRGFGSSRQNIEVSAVENSSALRIERTVVAVGNDGVVAGNGDQFQSSRSTSVLTPEQLTTGEWAGFAPRIQRFVRR